MFVEYQNRTLVISVSPQYNLKPELHKFLSASCCILLRQTLNRGVELTTLSLNESLEHVLQQFWDLEI